MKNRFFDKGKKKIIGYFGMTVCCIVLSTLFVSAQTSRGTVSGTVKDANGAVIPGASVTLTSEATSVERTTVANDDGFYRFDAVDLGSYTVKITAPNFTDAVKTGVNVTANQTATIDADLQVGGQQAVVEVVSGGDTIQTETAVRGGNISTNQITQLPGAGSNPTALALTLPGVSTNRGGYGVGTFIVNGARGRSNNFLIDGTENNDISVAGQGFQITNTDAVQEVSVQTGNYDAEFGRAGGAVVNVITRSGTRDFHGTLAFRYDTSQDDAITAVGARNPTVVAQGKNLFNDEKQYSGTFGGPLFLPRFGEGGPAFNTERGKNFFFVAHQEYRYRAPGSVLTLTTPTAAGRVVLQNYASNPNVAAYLAATANTVATLLDATRAPITLDPIGSTTTTRGTVEIGRYLRSYDVTNQERQFQIRTDHAITSNDQLSFRFLYDNIDQPLGGSVGFPGYDADYAARYRNFLISETHTFSPTVTNELRLAYNRIRYAFPIAGTVGLTQPLITIPNLTAFGTDSAIPQGRTADNYQIQDTVTKIFGDHTVRGGIDYTRQIATQIAPANTRGTLTYAASPTFTGLANFVDNFGGTNGSAARVFGNNVYAPKLTRIAGFLQDRWKFSDSLTLSGGVRYEYFGTPFNVIPTPAFTGLFNVDPATRSGAFQRPNQVAKDTNNFAPSVGLAYSPSYTDGMLGRVFGDRKTVFRMAYNIGYESCFNNITSNAVASAPNVIASNTVSLVTTAAPRGLANFSSQFPTTAAVVLPTGSQTLIDPNLVNPYYQRWSVGLQRSLPYGLVMDISYVGSKGTHLYASEELNPQVRPELRITPANYPRCDLTGSATVTAAQATAQFPTGSACPTTGRLDNIQGARQTRTNGGDSNYHAGQVEVRRRFASNFLVTGAYTFSKFISNVDEVFGVGIGSNTALYAVPVYYGGSRNDRGLSSYDRTHRASFTYVVESPFFRDQKGVLGRVLGGFQLSGITTFETGAPYTVFANRDTDGLGGALDRPVHNPNGQRRVRAVALVDGNNNITSWINPEIVTARNASGAAIAYQTIDPNTAEFLVYPTYVPGASGSVVRTGTLARNSERALGVQNTDLTILKRTRLGEKTFLELRTEMFNAFNNPQYLTGISSTADQLTQNVFLNPFTASTSGGGRVIRYQVKFVF